MSDYVTEEARAETTTTEPCPDHKPVQHRDGKPPWCPRCGLTAAMTEPVARFKRGRAETATEDAILEREEDEDGET